MSAWSWMARAQCAMSPGWAQCGMSPGRASCVTKQNHSTPFDVSAYCVSVSFFWNGMLITGFSTALGSMRDVAGLALLCCVWDAEPPFALPFLFPFPFKTFPLPKPSLFLLSPLSPYNPTAPWDRRISGQRCVVPVWPQNPG